MGEMTKKVLKILKYNGIKRIQQNKGMELNLRILVQKNAVLFWERTRVKAFLMTVLIVIQNTPSGNHLQIYNLILEDILLSGKKNI